LVVILEADPLANGFVGGTFFLVSAGTVVGTVVETAGDGVDVYVERIEATEVAPDDVLWVDDVGTGGMRGIDRAGPVEVVVVVVLVPLGGDMLNVTDEAAKRVRGASATRTLPVFVPKDDDGFDDGANGLNGVAEAAGAL
jgi:hypothetical protein